MLIRFSIGLEGTEEIFGKRMNNNKNDYLKLETAHVHIYKVFPKEASF